MAEAEDNKAERKSSAVAAEDNSVYEETAFGRRPVSKMPKWLAELIGLVTMPIVFIYRRLCRAKGG